MQLAIITNILGTLTLVLPPNEVIYIIWTNCGFFYNLSDRFTARVSCPVGPVAVMSPYSQIPAITLMSKKFSNIGQNCENKNQVARNQSYSFGEQNQYAIYSVLYSRLTNFCAREIKYDHFLKYILNTRRSRRLRLLKFCNYKHCKYGKHHDTKSTVAVFKNR